MTVPSYLLIDRFPPKKILERIKMAKIGSKMLEEYNKRQSHFNILPLNKWEKLLNTAGLKIIRHFYLFDEKSYKISILLDWLNTLSFYRIFIHFLE